MAKRTSILLEQTDNKSWLPAFSMLIIVCLLPFILIKLFDLHQLNLLRINTVPPTCSSISTANNGPVAIPPTPAPAQQPANLQQPATLQQPPPPIPSVNPLALSEQTIVTLRGDTLGKIFRRLGLSAKNLQEVVQRRPQSRILTHLKPGQNLTLTIKNHRVEKLVFSYSPAEDLIVTEVKHQYQGTFEKKKTTPRYQSITATVKGSLSSTAQRHHISYALIQQMRSIFSRNNDFKKGLRTGDRFSILYKANYIQDLQVGPGEILAASYTSQDVTHEAIRYTNRDGTSNYYTPQGLSLKIGYDRYPVRFSHIASTFSPSRYHPILHYHRPHYGIDLAAPIGTPIHAIGDGRIEIIDRQGGYGNMIKIHHNSMYSTIYGHLLRFEKGLYKGKDVKRGQIIGYVGQSGLASGPHCHFEFHINEQPKNPTTIALPHADPIPHREMTTFRQRVHQLLAALHAPHKSSTTLVQPAGSTSKT